MYFKQLLLVFVFIVSLFFTPKVFAQQVQSNETRLAAAAVTQNITLSEEAKAIVIEKCEAIQTTLKNLKNKNEKQTKLRNDTYKDIHQQLFALYTRLKRQSSQTGNIVGNLEQNQKEVKLFEQISQKYLQSLIDTTTISCKEKPELFVAGLTQVRTYRAELLKQANNVHNQINNQVVPSFNIVRGKLNV